MVGGNRSDQLVEMLEVAERLQAEIVRAVGDWDAQADWALDGALSPRSWLAHRAPITAAGASRLVSMGHLAREHERTGEALHAGDLSCAHVEVLAPMVRHREPEYVRNEEVLVETAASSNGGRVRGRGARRGAASPMTNLEARRPRDLRTAQLPCS